jgi:hypothetical protein
VKSSDHPCSLRPLPSGWLATKAGPTLRSSTNLFLGHRPSKGWVTPAQVSRALGTERSADHRATTHVRAEQLRLQVVDCSDTRKNCPSSLPKATRLMVQAHVRRQQGVPCCNRVDLRFRSRLLSPRLRCIPASMSPWHRVTVSAVELY